MSELPGNQPAPGWYPDPQAVGVLRWWDGAQWTADVRSLTEATSSRAPDQPSLRPVGDWMTETFRLVVGNAGALFTLMIVLIIPAALLSAASFWWGVGDIAFVVEETTAGFPSITDITGSGNPLLLGAGLLVYFLAYRLFAVAGTRLTMSARFEGGQGWNGALASGLGRFPKWFGWSFLNAALFMVAFLILNLITGVALVVAGILGALVAVVLFLVVAPIAAARYSMVFSSPMVGAAGERSPQTVHRLTKGHTWGLVGRSLLLLLVNIATWFAGSALSSPLAGLGRGSSFDANASVLAISDLMGGNVGIFMLAQLMNAIVLAVAAVLWHTGMSLMFEDLGGKVDPVLRRADEGSDVQ